MQHQRTRLLKIGFSLVFAILLSRLFYWQVINSHLLQATASSQRSSVQIIQGERGQILASDGYALVSNTPSYLLFAYTPQLEIASAQISRELAPILLDPNPKSATEAAKPLTERLELLQSSLLTKLTAPDKTWIPLQSDLDKPTKQQIQELGIVGLGFDEHQKRYYPEASMSAHLLGFVSHNDQGERQGYFGLEGYYNQDLQGRSGQVRQDKDAAGSPIIIGDFFRKPARPGRSLKLHLDRSLQHSVEEHLKSALEKYQAKSGEVVIMDPSTGAILAMAAQPAYDPQTFIDYPTNLYKNPIIADAYEPGSTFKVLVMAAAIEEGVISPDSICDNPCQGPVQIGKYSIRTWNNQYNPGQTMTEVLARSDNTGMIFVGQKLGKPTFSSYLDRFGFGRSTGIDLQEESVPTIRTTWGDIDLATASFGQGIAVTGIQMVKAVSAIANGGEMVEPKMVAEIHADKTLPITSHKTRVISPETSKQVTDMMVTAAHGGEAQWAVLRDYTVAGKTGTAQIPVAGHYDQDKTIASFIGFAPAYNPRFVMLVKLREPQSSPWAAETAAPLWYTIAKDALVHFGVPPDR